MSQDLKRIYLQIEEIRHEMNTIAMKKGLTCHEVIQSSQKLDTLLNTYNNLTKNKEKLLTSS